MLRERGATTFKLAVWLLTMEEESVRGGLASS